MIRLAVLLALLSTTAAPPLDQAGAVARALAWHPQLRAAAARVEAARAREVQAAAAPNPSLVVALDQVPVLAPGEGNFMVGASQPLWAGPQREARTAVAKLETEQAALELALRRQELAQDVKLAYARLLFDRAVQVLVGRQLAADDATLERARKRYAAGEAARVEILRAEVERARSVRELSAAAGRVRQADGKLAALLGQAPGVLAIPPRRALPPAAQLVQRAMGQRVELRLAALATTREGLQRQVALVGRYTGSEAAFSGGLVSGQPGFSTSFSIPVPFYRQQGEVAEAEANQARAAAEQEALDRQVDLEVRLAATDVEVAAGQVDAFTASYLPQAERLVENAGRRYAAGEGSAAEVLEARRAGLDTAVGQEEALLALRQAQARLERALGETP